MKKFTLVNTAVISFILIGMLLPSVYAKGGTSYSFNFKGPNLTMRATNLPLIEDTKTGMYVEPGAVLSLVGSVTFDPLTESVNGGGSYMHYAADGTKYAKGLWKADSFDSFVSNGGSSPGQQSGTLTIIIEATRIWSKYPGFEHVRDVKLMKLIVGDDGFTIMGGPGYGNQIFNVIVSGNTHFHVNS